MRISPSRSLLFCLSQRLVLVAILLLVFSHTTISPGQATEPSAEENASGQSQSAGKEDKEQIVDRGLAQLTPKATELSKKLFDMQDQLSDVNISEHADQQLVSLSEQATHLATQIEALEGELEGSRQKLTDLQIKLKATERKAKLVMQKIVSSMTQLDYWIDFWGAENNDIENWKKGLGASSSLPAVIHTFEELQAVIDTASETIEANLLPLLNMQKKAGAIQVALHSSILRTGELLRSKFNFDHHTSFLFSANYFNQFDSQLWKGALAEASGVFTPDFSYLAQNRNPFLLTLFLFVMLSTILQKAHQTFLKFPHLRFVSERPWAVALLISLMSLIPLLDTMTPFWLAVFRIVILLNMLVLSKVIIFDTFRKKVGTGLILLILATTFLKMIALPIVLFRVYILGVSFALVVVALLFFRRHVQSSDRPVWPVWCGRAMILAQGTVILAEMSGKPDLAYYIFSALFKTLFAALSIYILYLSVSGLLEILLHLSSVPYLQESAASICAALRPLLVIVTLIALTINTLVAWEIFPTNYDAFTGLGNLGFLLQGKKYPSAWFWGQCWCSMQPIRSHGWFRQSCFVLSCPGKIFTGEHRYP